MSDFELFDRHTEIVIHHLKSRIHEGQPVDFQDLMGRFTLSTPPLSFFLVTVYIV